MRAWNKPFDCILLGLHKQATNPQLNSLRKRISPVQVGISQKLFLANHFAFGILYGTIVSGPYAC